MDADQIFVMLKTASDLSALRAAITEKRLKEIANEGVEQLVPDAHRTERAPEPLKSSRSGCCLSLSLFYLRFIGSIAQHNHLLPGLPIRQILNKPFSPETSSGQD